MADREYHFQKLTPIDDADISVYEEAIDFVFDNGTILTTLFVGSMVFLFSYQNTNTFIAGLPDSRIKNIF